jgi:hypothetical protein
MAEGFGRYLSSSNLSEYKRCFAARYVVLGMPDPRMRSSSDSNPPARMLQTTRASL